MAKSSTTKGNTPLKYIERISQSTEDMKNEENLFLVEENLIQLRADLLAAQRALSVGKRKLNELLSENQLNSSSIMDQMELNTRRTADVATLNELIKQLF